MTSLLRASRGRAGALLGILLALAALPPAAAPAQAQTVEQVVVQRRLELRAARDAYEAARSAFSVVERQFSAALTEVRQARQSGDTDRLERAYALAQDRSVPYRDREQRLLDARGAVASARTALISAISARLEELVGAMDAATSAQQRNQLDALFRDLSNEVQALEAEEGDGFRIDLVVVPEITFDPRDGRDELLAKAEVLESRAALADSAIANTQRQLQSLNDRLRIQRQRRDFLGPLDRFEDTRVPVTTGPPTGERPPVSDSTVAGARPLTLEERIQNARDYILQLQSYRDQLLIRAEQFRRRVGTRA